jgi:hypothetical protein
MKNDRVLLTSSPPSQLCPSRGRSPGKIRRQAQAAYLLTRLRTSQARRERVGTGLPGSSGAEPGRHNPENKKIVKDLGFNSGLVIRSEDGKSSEAGGHDVKWPTSRKAS